MSVPHDTQKGHSKRHSKIADDDCNIEAEIPLGDLITFAYSAVVAAQQCMFLIVASPIRSSSPPPLFSPCSGSF